MRKPFNMPPQERRPVENKHSNLLTPEENHEIARLLGSRCKTLATTVVQLYHTQPPDHSQWLKKDTGVLCFVRDSVRKNYFFRIFCFFNKAMVWEQEIYNNMSYNYAAAYLHTFEGEDCMIALNFANEDEANDMFKVVNEKLLSKKKRENRTSSNQDSNQQSYVNQPFSGKSATLKPTVADVVAAKKAKRKRNITKADIGNPSEFRHVSHIGWDRDKGFNVNTSDVQLQEFFKKAGVSERHLQDRATREFIYDFIQKNGGRDAVEENVRTKRPAAPSPSAQIGPPVPPRTGPRIPHNRAAPPPPGVNQPPLRPPPQTPRTAIPPLPPGNAPPPPPMLLNGSVPTVPPPNSNSAPPPPPPPPPMMLTSPPPADSMDSSQTNMRFALMNSIRDGTSLKPIESVERKNSDVGRDDLLGEIKKGITLKPVTEREVKDVKPPMPSKDPIDLADALKRALEGRSRVIHSDDSDSDSNSDDGEWDA